MSCPKIGLQVNYINVNLKTDKQLEKLGGTV